MGYLRAVTFSFAILLSFVAISEDVGKGEGVLSPLEANEFNSLPSSAEIAEFLQMLADSTPLAVLLPLGQSAGGIPLQALCISKEKSFCQSGVSKPGKLSALLVGSQHGTEPSGAEALQRAAIELLHGSLRSYLATMDFMLVVNANPDGRDRRRRKNAGGVNLSTDFILLSEPESRAMVTVLNRFEPHVILDIHESALLKKRSLGSQGYMTDFEAQFETANNPNVEHALREWSQEHFLPALIAAASAEGLPARHYIGEITDINQTITHGGLSPRTLRNYAGLKGGLSVLLENRLDPPGDYATPRNIASRVKKQLVAITAFLAQCRTDRQTILEHVSFARSLSASSRPPQVFLVANYAPETADATIELPLRRRDSGLIEQHQFDYHSRVVASQPLPLPESYYLLENETELTELLERHGIILSRHKLDQQVPVILQRIETIQPSIHSPATKKSQSRQIIISERAGMIDPGREYLRIVPRGAMARVVPLLLDPRSPTSVFHYEPYAQLLIAGSDLRVVRGKKRALTP